MIIPPSIATLIFLASSATVFSLFHFWQKKSSPNEKDIGDFKLEDLESISEIKSIITYKEIMEYFVVNRPDDPQIKKGAILRWQKKNYWDFAQVFLNEQNQTVLDSKRKPYGRHFKVVDIDKELQDAFGKHDLIIVE